MSVCANHRGVKPTDIGAFQISPVKASYCTLLRMSEEAPHKRNLSQRYEVRQLRAVEKVEEDVAKAVCDLYGVTDVSLTALDIDLYKIWQRNPEERLAGLVGDMINIVLSVDIITSHCHDQTCGSRATCPHLLQ